MQPHFRLIAVPCWAVAMGFAALSVGAPPAHALEAITDGPPAREQFVSSVRATFAREDFAKLDEMADGYWRDKTRMPEGVWSLGWFYQSFTMPSAQGARMDWPAYLGRFGRWEQQRPRSLTARIAHAEALTAYAWTARGGGFADTVTPEGWRLFRERLAQARALLDSDPALRTLPGYFQVMQTVALGQQWERSEYDRLFADAVALAPDYEWFYFKKVTFLQPKWYGTSEDEWHQFALETAAATEAKFGQTLYTRIVWSAIDATPRNMERFRAAHVDWPRMRKGFEELLQKYPDSLWNKNAFCFYAWASGDRETARKLFAELGGRYAPTMWGSPRIFERAEAWSRGESRAPGKS